MQFQSKLGCRALAEGLSGDFNYRRLVINKASDFDIWKAVFDLIRSISRITHSHAEPTFHKPLLRLAFPMSLQPTLLSHIITGGSAEQMVQHNSDAIGRTIEKRNLADLRMFFASLPFVTASEQHRKGTGYSPVTPLCAKSRLKL